tara:strand:- start:58178 stop:58567 length:390 start_codon:yes stop_codon:yes gene_type:complete
MQGNKGNSGLKSILIVDDDPGIIDLFKEMFEMEGIQVFSAMTGQEALNEFRRVPCDYVLTDIVMPGELDGLEVILEIRDMNPNVKIFAMTGDADPSETKGYLDVAEVFGAEEVFQKPLSPQTIIDKIVA